MKMKILIIGAGVIGTIYGYALADAGNDITHYVRTGKKKSFTNGIRIHLLDGRESKPKEKEVLYPLKVTEDISSEDRYDLILVSVRHYQLESVLPLLRDHAGNADILFFNGNWDGLDIIDQYLPRAKYLWGFPVAGGGYTSWGLDAALLNEVRLGEIDGQHTQRIEQIAKMFQQAGIKVDVQDNMLHWLWVHFAINCGIIAAAFKAGGARELLNSISFLRLGILAGREALAVCQQRGVNVHLYEDARSFYAPALLGAIVVWFTIKTNRPARKIMESHTAIEELQRMCTDLINTGNQLKVDMLLLNTLVPYIENPIVK
jgi:2-dehydropantoate 2-reductase